MLSNILEWGLSDKPQEETIKPIAFGFKINTWKREYIKKAFPEYRWVFLRFNGQRSIKRAAKIHKGSVFVVWGYNESPGTTEYAERYNIPLYRLEDGFIRSIGLGANHILPASLALDKSGVMYFDPSNESDLEKLIFKECTEDDLVETRNILEMVRELRINKYNTQSSVQGQNYYNEIANNNKKRILVIGQVEDDASIKLGGCGYNNGQLVMKARCDHPDAEIFFKVHPDVLAGKRKILIPLIEIAKYAHIIDTPMNMIESFETIDEVYTISSLGGFEALIFDKKVTVAGQPFYSGYGLTNDLNPNPRRFAKYHSLNDKKNMLERVFRAAYIKYPRYYSPLSNQPSDIVTTLAELNTEKVKKIKTMTTITTSIN